MKRIKNKQKVKAIKHSDEDKKRKASYKYKNEIIFKLPLRRTTRLKSEIFVDSFRGHLPNDEYEITKENFNSAKLEYKPLRKKATLTNASNNETLNGTDQLLDFTAKTNDQTKRGGELKMCLKKFAHKTVTTCLDDQLKDLDQKNENELKNATSRRRRKQTKCNNPNLGKCRNGKADDDLENSKSELLDKTAAESKKVIKNESSNQLLDIKPNGYENKNASIKQLKKVVISELSLTENGNDVTKTNKTSEQDGKVTVKMSKDASLKRKRNSIRNTEPPHETLRTDNVQTDFIDKDNVHKSTLQANSGCRKSKSLNNSSIDINNKTLYSESPEENNKVLRNSKIIQLPQPVEKSATVSENPKTRSRKQISIQRPHMTTVTSKLNKSNNLLSKRKGRPETIKRRVSVDNIKACEIKSTKLSKLTKKQIEHVSTKKIPKNRLDEVLDMFNNDQHPNWEDRNVSCQPSIHSYWEPSVSLVSDQNMKLKYARQFLLRRDWVSLSKVLCLSNSKAKLYYPLLSKYAALLLAYTDKEQFDKFVQFLTSISDSSTVLKKCTTTRKETE